MRGDTVFYYVMYENNTPSGFVQSPFPRTIPNAIEVTEKKFISLGGSLSHNVPEMEPLESDVNLLKAQVQAQSDRTDFLEDCIAEMAMEVYGDV